jgi:hypothetical protein
MSKAIGFIYIWFNKKTKMYYLGSHKGAPDDGYVGSGKFFKSAYKKNPTQFKRKIIEFVENEENIILRENYWLSMIKPNELGNKYYNLKNVASGGDIVSKLSEKGRKSHSMKSSAAAKNFWDSLDQTERNNLNKKIKSAVRQFWENLSQEEKEARSFGGNVFDRSYMIERNKKLCSRTALIKTPVGEEIHVNNISEFCKTNNLNYGNMKTVLRGNSKLKSCKGYSGKYL